MTEKTQMQVLKIDLNSIPEYQGAKEKQETLVKENPYVEIQDSNTYELAKKNRTSLRQGRYELQNGEKAIASQIKKFRDFVKIETEKLINITLPHEDKQQTEVERYEAIIQAEKEERKRVERERIEKIKNTIIEFRQLSQTKINNSDLSTIDEVEHEIINATMEIDEEFVPDLQLVKDQLILQVATKREQLDEAESMRLEKERLAADREKLEQERKAQEAEIQKLRDEAEAKRKADETRLKEQEEKAAAIRKEEQDNLAKERAALETERLKLQQAENERIAKEHEEKTQKLREMAIREGHIDTYCTLTGTSFEAASILTNEQLTSEIKRINDAKEKARLHALKSDKEKALEIVKSLSIQYGPEIKIQDKGLDDILADFIGKTDQLMKEFITIIETY